jgi:hypothetical protein
MQREVWIKDNPNESLPIFWDKQDDKGILYGKKGKVHTVSIPVKVPKVRMDYDLRAVNDKGKLIVRQDESHSWTRNYYNFTSSLVGSYLFDATNFQDGKINIKDTAGTVFSSSNTGVRLDYQQDVELLSYGYMALSGEGTKGIVTGTGSAGESIDDFILGTQITHGIGAGNLFYQTSHPVAVAVFDAGTRVLSRKLTRFFDNFSGGDVTIKEIGQIARAKVVETDSLILVARDLIGDLVVANKSCAAISYIYSLTYPSSGNTLRNFYNLLFSTFSSTNGKNSSFSDGNINIKDTAGSVRYGAYPLSIYIVPNSAFGWAANSTDITAGAVVGSGNTAVTFNDYVLAQLINNGTGSGQMTYSATETPIRAWSDPIMTIQHARTMSNGSAGSITVKEVGLLATTLANRLSYSTIHVRDVISDVAVAVGESIRVIHKFEVAYP